MSDGSDRDALALRWSNPDAGLAARLQALGLLVALDEVDTLEPLAREPRLSPGNAPELSILAHELSAQESQLVEALDCLEAGLAQGLKPGQPVEAISRVFTTIADRHTLELILVALEHLEAAPALMAEITESVAAIDQLLERRLWLLLPENDRRRGCIDDLEENTAERFWWYSRSAELPPNALDAMVLAADILEQIPGARRCLELHGWTGSQAAPRASVAEVVPFPHERDTEDSEVPSLRLAAASRIQLSYPEVEVVTDGYSLELHVLEDLVVNRGPVLHISGTDGATTLDAVPLEGGNQAFSLARGLQANAHGEKVEKLELWLPLAAGALLIPLPVIT